METLKVLQKLYDMMLYAHPALNQYPRSEKHTLAANIKVTMLNMVRLATRANKERRKIEFLRELDAELESLRFQVRLSTELGFLPHKKYQVWSGMLTEIGRMIGGWIKSSKF